MGPRPPETTRTGGGNESPGEASVIAVLFELGNHDGADRGSVRDGGAGHTGHEHTRQDDCVSQTAGDVADKVFKKLNDLIGYAGGVHKRTGHHEKRDRDK